jgi:hypothetical protein
LKPAVKIILAIGIIIIACQFFRPARNTNSRVTDADISKIVSTPDSVLYALKNACYDCHSNNTVYPWYANLQPVAWLISCHIRKGKEELNFSEFGNYSNRRQVSKLDGIANSILDDIMPLASYRMMHLKAQLSASEKSLLIKWIQQAKDSLSEKRIYPESSINNL